MGLQQYDPKNVALIFGGALITGFAEGSFINVEFNADLFTLAVGSDGEGTRSKSNNQSARITVTLMGGAAGNLVFNATLQADKAANAGAVPVKIVDPSTGTLFAAEGSWVVREPGRDFQTEGQPVEWVIEALELVSFYGAAV